MSKTYSIEELADPGPLRPSYFPETPIPPKGWWFPDYIPKWVRMLSYDEYVVRVASGAMGWQLDHDIKKGLRRRRGRPRPNTVDQDRAFIRNIQAAMAILRKEGKRVTLHAALKAVTGKKNVGAERARVRRILKLYKKRDP